MQVEGWELVVVERELCGAADEIEEQVRDVLQRAGRVLLEPAFRQIADRTPAPCCINTVLHQHRVVVPGA